MRIKFTTRKDRISMNRSNRKQMMSRDKMVMGRLMGHKQTRNMRGRSVSQACHQSFDGMSFLHICFAAKRVACLSVGSELSLVSVICQLCLMHGTNDGSDLFN